MQGKSSFLTKMIQARHGSKRDLCAAMSLATHYFVSEIILSALGSIGGFTGR